MGGVMNMDVSRQCALVLLMKLCKKLKGEENKVMESGRSLCKKQSLKTLLHIQGEKHLVFSHEIYILTAVQKAVI
jgi:hypothetical protein